MQCNVFQCLYESFPLSHNTRNLISDAVTSSVACRQGRVGMFPNRRPLLAVEGGTTRRYIIRMGKNDKFARAASRNNTPVVLSSLTTTSTTMGSRYLYRMMRREVYNNCSTLYIHMLKVSNAAVVWVCVLCRRHEWVCTANIVLPFAAFLHWSCLCR